MSDKSANLILSKLKEIPQPPPLDEILTEEIPAEQDVCMNPMPLVQDVGLPLPEEMTIQPLEPLTIEPIDIDRNGIEEQQGKWKIFPFRAVNYS